MGFWLFVCWYFCCRLFNVTVHPLFVRDGGCVFPQKNSHFLCLGRNVPQFSAFVVQPDWIENTQLSAQTGERGGHSTHGKSLKSLMSVSEDLLVNKLLLYTARLHLQLGNNYFYDYPRVECYLISYYISIILANQTEHFWKYAIVHATVLSYKQCMLLMLRGITIKLNKTSPSLFWKS